MDSQINLDEVSDFELLAYSGARQAVDTFQLINPLTNIEAPCKFIIEVAGCRYYKDNFPINGIKVNDVVQFIEEPTNEFDNNAVTIQIDNKIIGYINRTQALSLKQCLSDFDIYTHINKVNGTKERPRLYVCVEIS